MPRLPKIQSLPLQTASILTKKILQGDYQHTLPGEYDLATELQVSRGTLRKALQKLTINGLLLPPCNGQRRKIAPGSAAPLRARPKQIGILLPKPHDELHPSSQDLFRAYRKKLESSQINCTFHAVPYHKMIRPHRQLSDLIEQQTNDLWIVYEITKPVARWFAKNKIPGIFCGGEFHNKYSSVYYNGSATIIHALRLLFRTGHRQIIHLYGHDVSRLKQIMHDVFAEYQHTFDPHFHIQQCHDSKSELAQIFRSLFRKQDPPTAFITSTPPQLLCLITWLGRQGLRIPEDVSILHVGSDPILEPLIPDISHYSTRFKPLASALYKTTHELLETGTSKSKKLLMEYVSGRSVAPPKTLP